VTEDTRSGEVEPPVSGADVPIAVTFLFTDVGGSTQPLRRLGAREYAKVLAEHDRVLRAAIAGGGGEVVDTQGDAVFAAFSDASRAVGAAVAAQRSLKDVVASGDAGARPSDANPESSHRRDRVRSGCRVGGRRSHLLWGVGDVTELDPRTAQRVATFHVGEVDGLAVGLGHRRSSSRLSRRRTNPRALSCVVALWSRCGLDPPRHSKPARRLNRWFPAREGQPFLSKPIPHNQAVVAAVAAARSRAGVVWSAAAPACCLGFRQLARKGLGRTARLRRWLR
jgi:hypothetical protein